MNDLVPLKESAPLFGIEVSRHTVRNWAVRGVSDRRGGRVKLACVRVGGRLYVTREAAQEFLRRTAQPAVPEPDRDQTRRLRQANEYLKAVGCE